MRIRDNEEGPFDKQDTGGLIHPRACGNSSRGNVDALLKRIRELEEENRALRAENSAMLKVVGQFESRSQKIVGSISRLEDVAKKASEGFKLGLEKNPRSGRPVVVADEKQAALSKRTIESVDSQSGYGDEGSAAAGKMVLLEGIMQSIEQLNSLATESCCNNDPEENASAVSETLGRQRREVRTLRARVRREKGKVAEYTEFLRSVMNNLSQIADDCEDAEVYNN